MFSPGDEAKRLLFVQKNLKRSTTGLDLHVDIERMRLEPGGVPASNAMPAAEDLAGARSDSCDVFASCSSMAQSLPLPHQSLHTVLF